MKPKVWIWAGVLAFLGYSIAAKTVIENTMYEVEGLVVGAGLGFLIGVGPTAVR